MSAPLTIIVNCASGGGNHRKLADSALEMLASRGKMARVLETSDGASIPALAAKAVAEGAEAVIAAGGDGTVNAVASALAGTEVPLGVLPIGTLNHFARDLGMPVDLERAVDVLAAGHTMRIDIGEVNGRIFVNNSSLGLYPILVRKRESRQRMGFKKWPAFFWAAMAVLRRYPFLNVRLEIGGRSLGRRTPFVFIGNNVYQMEGLNIGSRAALTDGVLCLYVTHRTGRWGLLRLALSALVGRLNRQKNFDSICARDFWVETRRKRMQVALDGEVTTMGSPLHYQVRAGALRVIGPKAKS